MRCHADRARGAVRFLRVAALVVYAQQLHPSEPPLHGADGLTGRVVRVDFGSLAVAHLRWCRDHADVSHQERVYLLIALLAPRLAAPRAFGEAVERLLSEAVAAIWWVDEIPTVYERASGNFVRSYSSE